ncbi:MAG: ABC-ATPase domain-containing protein, partial [Cyanobacteria bacterium P01_H01_bin.130]
MATVKTDADLRNELNRLDGKGYKAYRDIEAVWYEFENFVLRIDRAQGDPFAAPSACRVWVPPEIARF